MSATRQSGQGLDSSLKRRLIFTWTRLQHCVDLGAVTQYSVFTFFSFLLIIRKRTFATDQCRIHNEGAPSVGNAPPGRGYSGGRIPLT